MSQALSGPISEGVFPGLLRGLYVARRTGLLHFATDEDRGSVCFLSGQIAWGQSSVAECQLGPVLVRHGLVAQEALDQVYDLVGGGKRLGDLLLELGSLNRETLDQALALQVRETLLHVFTWKQGSWRFEEQPLERFHGYDQGLGVATGDLILDAVWSVVDPDVVRYALGDLDRILTLTADPLLRSQRLTLTSADTLLLSFVDGRRTAREILQLMPADALEAPRCLLGLLCTGLLELAASTPAAPEESPPTRQEILALHDGLPSRDHFEVLGLLHNSGPAEAAEAFVRLAGRYGPGAQADRSLQDLRPQLEAIAARLAEAARVLADPERRSAYESALAVAELGTLAPQSAPPQTQPDAPLDLSQVDDVLERAEAEFGAGRYWDALQVVESLPADLPGRQRRRVRLLRARVFTKNPKWQREAEDELKTILAEDPANPEAYFLLGQIYKAGGLATRAAAMFRRVLDLKPRHAGALQELGSRAASHPRRPAG